MDHGSHAFYLACDWMGACPEAISARTATAGPHDTEDDFACSMRFAGGLATAHLTWTAGFRKVIYSIHGDRGGILAEDDRLEVHAIRPDPRRSYGAEWDITRHTVPSEWMDSSHVSWFASLFDDFRQAIARGEVAGRETEHAYRCVKLIETAYASAEAGSRELVLEEHALRAARSAEHSRPDLRLVRRGGV